MLYTHGSEGSNSKVFQNSSSRNSSTIQNLHFPVLSRTVSSHFQDYPEKNPRLSSSAGASTWGQGGPGEILEGLEGHQDMASAGARAYNGGLGAVPGQGRLKTIKNSDTIVKHEETAKKTLVCVRRFFDRWQKVGRRHLPSVILILTTE